MMIMKFTETIKRMNELLEKYDERYDDFIDDLKEEVKENIKSIVESMADDCDDDLLDFVNEHCGGSVYAMEETAFNDYCSDHDISSWDLLDYDFGKYDNFFGNDCGGDLITSNDLEDFVDINDVVTELIDREEDLGNSDIREELDRLNEPDESIEEEFMAELKKLLGIEEKKEESNEDFKKVISWIYEHKMLGEDFDNKFPKLAEVYREEI